MRRIAILLVAVAVAACESSPNGPRELLRIVEAQARWEAQGLRDYDFRFEAGCVLCDPDPKHIEVRNGLVLRAISEVTGDTTGPGAGIPTIDSLYAWVLRDREADHCGRQAVEVDAERHYPRQMSCSGVPEIADSGHWWTVSGFQFVPTTTER